MRCTCGHPDDYNYAINNGLCNSCIAEKLDQLEDKNKQLRKERQTRRQWQTCPNCNRIFATVW